ncbi:hypothetical protein BCR36DRAFT_340662, partial [Piromyces finnis]
MTKTPIIKYLLQQILNKNFDVTKASYHLLLRLSNSDTLANNFIKEWGSMHVSSVMKNKNIDLLFPVVLLIKKLLIKGKLNKKNDSVNSNSILKVFQTMREKKRKESGNNTDYNIVTKKLENEISEFHSEVYVLDNLEKPAEIPVSTNKLDENENEDETELLQLEDKFQNKQSEEEDIKEEEIDISKLMELKKQEEEEKEREREREREREYQKEKRKDGMLKKYNIEKNDEEQIDYTKLDDIYIDDEYNKINKNSNDDISNLTKENKTFNQKIDEIRKKIIDK